MKNRQDRRQTRPVLIGGLAILVLLCAVGSCLGFYRWWSQAPGEASPSATVEASIASPTADNVALQTDDSDACDSVPSGWTLYEIQPGDTLSDLAAHFQVSQARIMQANCLNSADLLAGQALYLPSLPTPTPCRSERPAGWVLYTVQTNDNISSLADARGTTSADVLRVNCLPSAAIEIGQQLLLPALPTATPTPLPTASPTPLPTASPTVPPIIAATAAPPTAEASVAGPSTPAPTVSVSTALPPTETPPTVEILASTPTFRPTPIPVDLVVAGDSGGTVTGAERFNDIPCDDAPPGELTLDTFEPVIQLGQRIYYFTCNFTNPTSATLLRSDGITESLKIHGPDSNALPPYISVRLTGTVTAAIEWAALPTLPITSTLAPQIYTLTVIDEDASSAPGFFTVEPPTAPNILVVPQAGPLYKTNFMVYYVNFTPSLTVTIDLFSEFQPKRGETVKKLYYRQSNQVFINQTMSIDDRTSGWAVVPLDLGPALVPLQYGLNWNNLLGSKQPDWTFWPY